MSIKRVYPYIKSSIRQEKGYMKKDGKSDRFTIKKFTFDIMES